MWGAFSIAAFLFLFSLSAVPWYLDFGTHKSTLHEHPVFAPPDHLRFDDCHSNDTCQARIDWTHHFEKWWVFLLAPALILGYPVGSLLFALKRNQTSR
jgi:hypothetical protein